MCIRDKFKPYIGKNYVQICNDLGIEPCQSKSKYADVSALIASNRESKRLNTAEEFVKSGIMMKTVRLRKNEMCIRDGRIHVEVDPLEPVARIFDRDSSYYINRAGKRISATARYHSDVPIVSGAFTKEFPPTEVLPLVSFINNDSTWSTLITHIKAYDRRNVILVPMIHGHVINIEMCIRDRHGGDTPS